MRKVNLASFLTQSKHAAEWQRKTLDAARAAGHDVFQDCIIVSHAAPSFKCVDRPAGVWNSPTEEESDAERDRR